MLERLVGTCFGIDLRSIPSTFRLTPCVLAGLRLEANITARLPRSRYSAAGYAFRRGFSPTRLLRYCPVASHFARQAPPYVMTVEPFYPAASPQKNDVGNGANPSRPVVHERQFFIASFIQCNFAGQAPLGPINNSGCGEVIASPLLAQLSFAGREEPRSNLIRRRWCNRPCQTLLTSRDENR